MGNQHSMFIIALLSSVMAVVLFAIASSGGHLHIMDKHHDRHRDHS